MKISVESLYLMTEEEKQISEEILQLLKGLTFERSNIILKYVEQKIDLQINQIIIL